MNIAKAINSDKLLKFSKKLGKLFTTKTNHKNESEEEKEQREKFKEIDNNINDGLVQQKEKLITPLVNIVNKTKKSSILFIFANVVSIILGIILLIFPDVSMMVWGIIFLYTGLPNLFAAIKSIQISKKLKEKKYKEILFDAEKDKKKKQPKKREAK